MIPFLNQKIWYAFQGLPIEQFNGEDRLPWSKCLVLTNNLMQILKCNQLAETFKRSISKIKAEEQYGVTVDEYIKFISKHFDHQNQTDKPIIFNEQFSSTQCHDQEHQVEQEKELPLSTSLSKSISYKSYTKHSSDIAPYIKNFDDYCWTLFRTKNIPSIGNQSSLNDGYFNLWLLFITYSMKSLDTGDVDIPVRMDLVEARHWCGRMRELLGVRRSFDEVEIEEEISSVPYQELYAMFQDLFKNVHLSESVVEIALRELSEEALEGVTMKGPIKIEHNTRYCVLKCSMLIIYTSKVSAVNFRSCFLISGDTSMMAGNNRIQLKSPGFSYISMVNMEIPDIQHFNKWRSAFTEAIEHSKSKVLNPAMAEAQKRELARNTKRAALREKRLILETEIERERKERSTMRRAMEQQLLIADQRLGDFKEKMTKEINEKEILIKQNEDIRRATEEQIRSILMEQQAQYKLQLDKVDEIMNEKESLNEKLQATIEEKSNEEMKRTMLEEQHIKAKQMLLDAEKKIETLQTVSEQLEKALEEERQAKEEEEAVQRATISLLEKEKQSKENLEALLQQQNSMIDQEIQKRNEFAQELENERVRIKEIADEKEKLNKQLEESQQKMQTTGNRVKKLDTKVAQIAENVFGKEQTNFPTSHRGQGFYTK